MQANKDKIISFDEFLSDFFFSENGEKIEKKVKTDNVKLKKHKQEKDFNNFESVLNKFFPGNYKSSIDLNDKMVKKWTSVFDELKNDIVYNQNRTKKETTKINKDLDRCKNISFKITDRLKGKKEGSIVVEHEISWLVQLAAASLIVFAVSSVFFNSNPGVSENVLNKISRMTNTGFNGFSQSELSSLSQNQSVLKSQPEIRISKEDLSNYIKNNYENLKPSLSGHSVTKTVNHDQITGRVAGVVEIRDPKIEEKRETIYSLINEGEKIIFEMLKSILNK